MAYMSSMISESFVPPSPLNTAVLLIVFNRPECTSQMFDAIRKAKPPRLYISSDGPRSDREGEFEIVNKVRKIVTCVDWPCDVKTLFRNENIGCQYGPKKAIDWFFEFEDCGIILEDDCVPSQSFFWFCQVNLERYQQDDSIMVITGTNISSKLTFDSDCIFSKYPLMWGWASWRRAWSKYDPILTDWPELKVSGWLKSLDIGGLLFQLKWQRIFNLTVELQSAATWWDYQWIYSCWINNGLTIAPAKNLIRNIGFKNDATHTRKIYPILSFLVEEEMNFPLRYPQVRRVDKKLDNFISRHWFGVSLRSYVKSALTDILDVSLLGQVKNHFFGKK